MTHATQDERRMSAETQNNSMAAVMSGVMLVVIWAAIIIGGIALVGLSIGLFANLQGGAVDLPGGSADVDGVPTSVFIAALASLIVVLPGIVFICMQLRRVLATLAAGDPFVPANAPRLTRIAIALALMELGRYVVIALLTMFINFNEVGDGPSLNINLAVWASVAALLVLSQVFREGTRLRDQEKMTI